MPTVQTGYIFALIDVDNSHRNCSKKWLWFHIFETIATNVPNSNFSRNVTTLRIVITLLKKYWYDIYYLVIKFYKTYFSAYRNLVDNFNAKVAMSNFLYIAIKVRGVLKVYNIL